MWEVIFGDVRDKIKEIPDQSVQCIVTSPPYWGLRDYGTATWKGGNPECDHVIKTAHGDGGRVNTQGFHGSASEDSDKGNMYYENLCAKCGAVRSDDQLGLENTPAEFVENMVVLFRELWRVLRDDGTVWLNLGDSYNAQTGTGYPGTGQVKLDEASKNTKRKRPPGIKPKDLCGIPWMVALALREDGWYLRSDIIWAKPNPMPESATDRPTKSHEHIFLLTKKPRYYYDAEAIREPQAEVSIRRAFSNNNIADRKDADNPNYAISGKAQDETYRRMRESIEAGEDQTRNKRDVWFVATQPYSGAHFATFPPKLIEPCILAGTSPKACEMCGAPWERVIEKGDLSEPRSTRDNMVNVIPGRDKPCRMNSKNMEILPKKYTGWKPTCDCDSEGTGRCVVFDPFVGSGTTLMVAEQNNRDSIGIDLNPDNMDLINERMDDMQMRLF